MTDSLRDAVDGSCGRRGTGSRERWRRSPTNSARTYQKSRGIDLSVNRGVRPAAPRQAPAQEKAQEKPDWDLPDLTPAGNPAPGTMHERVHAVLSVENAVSVAEACSLLNEPKTDPVNKALKDLELLGVCTSTMDGYTRRYVLATGADGEPVKLPEAFAHEIKVKRVAQEVEDLNLKEVMAIFHAPEHEGKAFTTEEVSTLTGRHFSCCSGYLLRLHEAGKLERSPRDRVGADPRVLEYFLPGAAREGGAAPTSDHDEYDNEVLTETGVEAANHSRGDPGEEPGPAEPEPVAEPEPEPKGEVSKDPSPGVRPRGVRWRDRLTTKDARAVFEAHPGREFTGITFRDLTGWDSLRVYYLLKALVDEGVVTREKRQVPGVRKKVYHYWLAAEPEVPPRKRPPARNPGTQADALAVLRDHAGQVFTMGELAEIAGWTTGQAAHLFRALVKAKEAERRRVYVKGAPRRQFVYGLPGTVDAGIRARADARLEPFHEKTENTENTGNTGNTGKVTVTLRPAVAAAAEELVARGFFASVEHYVEYCVGHTTLVLFGPKFPGEK